MSKKKTYTTEEVLKKIKRDSKKKRPVVNGYLKKRLQKIVKEELGKEYRSDAMNILLKANRGEVAEFLFTYYSDKTNAGLIGIALDFIKARLVKDKEVDENFANSFGVPEEFLNG